jgi:flavin reductase (DIM6/NTAB) family NADH-FMN oxidoreductase RutF
LDEALVHIACKVIDTHAAGDHTIFIGQVETTEIFDGDPLVYFRGGYRKIEL